MLRHERERKRHWSWGTLLDLWVIPISDTDKTSSNTRKREPGVTREVFTDYFPTYLLTLSTIIEVKRLLFWSSSLSGVQYHDYYLPPSPDVGEGESTRTCARTYWIISRFRSSRRISICRLDTRDSEKVQRREDGVTVHTTKPTLR